MANDDDIEVKDAPPGVQQPHAQTEAFGIQTGFGTGSSLDRLIVGNEEFPEWTAQGNRTAPVRVAEVMLSNQTAALRSRAFPVRSRMFKAIHQQDALRTIFAMPEKKMDKVEIMAVLGIMAFFLVVLFLVYTVGAD